MMVLIKPTKQASHKMVVDILDEMSIGMVKKYALVNLTEEERQWLLSAN